MEHGGNIYRFGIISSEERKSEVVVFNFVDSSGGENNDNQLCFISAEPAARRK